MNPGTMSLAKLQMPPARYSFWNGDYDLSEPVVGSTDTAVQTVCEAFLEADAGARDYFRQGLTEEECYTLLTFSRRAGALAIRDSQPDLIRVGALAIAMITSMRVDPRDICTPVEYLALAAQVTGVDHRFFLERAAELADAPVSTALRQCIGRVWSPESSGLVLVENNRHKGLIRRAIEPYSPTLSLDKGIVQLASMLRAHDYQPGDIFIAVDLPRVWLSGVEDPALRRAMQDIRGVASVSAYPTACKESREPAQRLAIFLAELAGAEAAAALTEIAVRRGAGDPSAGILGVSRDLLFCLLVGRSTVAGVPSLEDRTSLARFTTPVLRILDELCRSSSGTAQ
jgi:hypothetical protein